MTGETFIEVLFAFLTAGSVTWVLTSTYYDMKISDKAWLKRRLEEVEQIESHREAMNEIAKRNPL